MGETMTVYDLGRETIRMMETIAVPVALMDSIGAPIRASIGNLRACLDAWDRDNAQKAAAAEKAAAAQKAAAEEQEVAEHDQAE